MNLCPTCGGRAVRTCRCRLGDSWCAQGHAWHRCPVHGEAHPWASGHAGGSDCRPGQAAPPPAQAAGPEGAASFTFDLEA